MAKKEELVQTVDLDMETIQEEPVYIKQEFKATEETTKEKKVNTNKNKETNLINCLRNERIIVRHIPKERGGITNPKHVLYGGMAENATRTFVVPRLSSGMYVNVLTDDEKNYLEYIMQLDDNALSIYKKKDNFWDDSNESGISRVRLTKQDNFFNLADPEDYIRYKILLANKNFIAPSLQDLQDRPKATYQFVIIADGDEDKKIKDTMNITMKCYKEYGKIEDDIDLLRVVIETLEGKPTSSNVKIEFLQARINNLIQANSKFFLKVITDPLLKSKALIKKCVEAGLIAKRGDYYYLRSDNSPLCENGEDPTFSMAAKYISTPKRQDLKFTLEAKLKQ